MAEATTEERWLPIPGYEGGYEASSHGRVRSLDRTIICKNGVIKRRRGVVLQPGVDSGRLLVNLHWNGAHGTRKVHQLVLEAFVGPRPDGAVCCHWDDDFTNNRVDNLRWATQVDNMQDSVRNGVNSRMVRTHCPRGHPLAAPNLVPSELVSRGRKCLACDRAASMARNRSLRDGEVRWEDIDMKALSDAYYAEIVSTDGAQRIRSYWKRHDILIPRLRRRDSDEARSQIRQ